MEYLYKSLGLDNHIQYIYITQNTYISIDKFENKYHGTTKTYENLVKYMNTNKQFDLVYETILDKNHINWFKLKYL